MFPAWKCRNYVFLIIIQPSSEKLLPEIFELALQQVSEDQKIPAKILEKFIKY